MPGQRLLVTATRPPLVRYGSALNFPRIRCFMHDDHSKPRPPHPMVPAFNAAWLENLRPQLANCILRDRRRLTQWIETLLPAARSGRPLVPQMRRLEEALQQSCQQAELRRQHLPKPTYPSDLPVVARRQEIADVIAANQVVVICGQTGSGKTTQIPKICLELGRSIHGLIGHTQPRRLAARTVAARIAQELRTPLGHAVGFKVRFDEQTRPQTYIKLMTDGILLAETQGDRLLEQYDTLIIDEAHERSLNIDFLLGYLRQLLPQRPDLKIIITSATIDPERFAAHFATGEGGEDGGGKPAPIIEVSGRTYPVEMRYRPILTEEEDEEDPNILGAIVDAVRELFEGGGGGGGAGGGDILIFLSGEREIRLTAEALTQANFRHTEILPLYARLSIEEQTRIFTPHSKRRIVLATNVAETSLTVPGIKYVIDPGFARISRYSAKTKVQRLPIEKVSQASAEQRKGRCGRTSPGICIRLYSEEDFQARPAFTEPEILRTNLASVILQMKALHLGEIDQFPFLEPPDSRQIRDGYQTLFELNAITPPPTQELTPLGRQLSRLPIDPRIGRMILAATSEGGARILEPVLIIAAALSVQDPRLRPMDAQTQADEAHLQFRDPTSDFLCFLKLWEWFTRTAKHHSLGQLRKACIEKYISYIRMREWQDIHRQLKELATELGLSGADALVGSSARSKRHHADEGVGTTFDVIDSGTGDSIHRAILAGLLSNVGYKTEGFDYTGARGRRFSIFPGSALFRHGPAWVMAAEIVETTRLYARTVAPIRPSWLEKIAAHLIERSYTELRWESSVNRVEADERVMLYGMVIVPQRRVHYGPINPAAAREIFLRYALLEGDYHPPTATPAPYVKHNHTLIRQVHQLESKTRRLDLLLDSLTRYEFFNQRVPEGINSGSRFESWRRQAERENPHHLFMNWEHVVRPGITPVSDLDYPDTLQIGESRLPLTYQFAPGEPEDGVTLTIPLTLLSQLSPERFEWLIPAWLLEKITALIKSLPTAIRRTFVPVPQFAKAALEALGPEPLLSGVSLQTALALKLGEFAGTEVAASSWRPEALPDYLHMNFRIVDERGLQLAQGRDLAALQERLATQITGAFVKLDHPFYNIKHVWSWDDLQAAGIPDPLPERVELQRLGMKLFGYPALMATTGDTSATGINIAHRTAGAPPTPALRGGRHAGVPPAVGHTEAARLDLDAQGVVANNLVALGLLDSPEAARAAQRKGLIRLLILSLQSDLRHLAHNFPEKDRIYIHYALIGTPQELRNDLLHAIVERTFLDPPVGDTSPAEEIRSRAAFLQRRTGRHTRLAPTSEHLAALVRQILEIYHTLTLDLERPSPADQTAARFDIKEQLAALLPRHFVARTPYEWLVHFPRYLQAIQTRLAKLVAGHLGRDARHAREIDILWQNYQHRQARHTSLHLHDPELIRFRWMIEELRVSLFAQELSTAFPVSVRRLEKQLTLVRG